MTAEIRGAQAPSRPRTSRSLVAAIDPIDIFNVAWASSP